MILDYQTKILFIYLVATTKYKFIVVKRVYDAGDSIRCVSNNKDYPDFNIPKSEIRSMHLMVGLIRRY